MEYSWNIFEKNLQKNLLKYLKNISTILLKFVLKICQNYFIFKVFQVHLKAILLPKNNGYKFFYIIFEGSNVNETISYFGHL
jgi:hypothetical protein